MQKFVATSIDSISAGANTRTVSLPIPEEIVVKRLVLQVIPVSAATGLTNGAFIASICQNDSNNPDAGDSVDENRLVRSVCGNAGTPANLDHTITMRKLAGSGVTVQVENLSGTSESYATKLTIHYLEV